MTASSMLLDSTHSHLPLVTVAISLTNALSTEAPIPKVKIRVELDCLRANSMHARLLSTLGGVRLQRDILFFLVICSRSFFVTWYNEPQTKTLPLHPSTRKSGGRTPSSFSNLKSSSSVPKAEFHQSLPTLSASSSSPLWAFPRSRLLVL